MLVIIGIACLALAGLALRGLQRQPGKPEPVWTDTEWKASAVALSLILLLLGGVSFIVKGLLGQ
jgi:hypothetical protein